MPDVLGLMAEIAVAIAGFTAVFSVLDPRQGGLEGLRQTFRVRQMLMVSIFAALGSLCPLVLDQFPWSEVVVWRVSGALASLVLGFLFLQQSKQIVDLGFTRLPDYSLAYATLIRVIAVGSFVALMATVVTARSVMAPALYVTGMAGVLSIASFQFVRAGLRQLSADDSD